MNKLTMKSADMTQVNIDKIAELFPNVITEARDEQGKVKRTVDFDLLRQELSDYLVEGEKERYQLTWPGKKEAILQANSSIDKTLRPAKEDSDDWENTRNLYIEGDNLEVLKLLQESYLNKIKIIYIDPPYNTGKDFIYKDNFNETCDEYLEESGQIDEDGNRLFQNTDSNGRFHSDWLTMMYSRIKIARNLLREDGVLFVSIGNEEVDNLRKICDEIMGSDNFVESIVWNKRIPKNDKGIGSIHEYILIYVKSNSYNYKFTMTKDGLDEINELLKSLKKNNTPIKEAEKELRKLYEKKGYDRGITLYNSLDKNYKLWGKINLSWPNGNTFGPRYDVLHPVTGKPTKVPDRGWRWKKSTFDDYLNYDNLIKLENGSYMCGQIWFAEDENTQPSLIKYLEDVDTLLLRSVLSYKSDGGMEVEGIFEGKSFFAYPKPTSIINLIIKSVETKPGDIVLDFFSGSSTTAHAVMNSNAEDKKERKYIMVQLPEETTVDSEAYKAGYKNICEIGKERIRRAAKKIKEETGEDIDYGFRVYRVDSSNMKDVYYTPDKLGQLNLDDVASNIKEDRTGEDLLTQVMLECGLELSLPMESIDIEGKTVHYVAGNSLIACFDDELSESVIKKIAEDQPLRVVFRDSSFQDDCARINVEELFKLLSPSTEIQVL
ncbi:site-specific DNA-methyltransferase [Paenibacillus sp. FSL R7-0048]|uniref:site-specific DNA-methyltransferase n=1 Tax=Paenibacillus sp. FSL R7-0048 TaxID=2954528 RepID=UPI0030F912AF